MAEKARQSASSVAERIAAPLQPGISHFSFAFIRMSVNAVKAIQRQLPAGCRIHRLPTGRKARGPVLISLVRGEDANRPRTRRIKVRFRVKGRKA